MNMLLCLDLRFARGDGSRQAMLDERLPDLPAESHDDNSYTFGRVHGHNIAITCPPVAVYGTTSATTLATDIRTSIRSSFLSIRFGLMVGVGGGVPNAGVQLGNAIWRDLEHTGMLNKPPTVLLTTISRLQAAHLQRPSQVPVMILEALESNSMMVTIFGYPDTSDGTIGEQKLATPKQACKIHYGLIASGNRVTDRSSDDYRSGTVLTWTVRKVIQLLCKYSLTTVQILICKMTLSGLLLLGSFEFNRWETVKLLIACRAKTNFPFYQFTPLQIASIKGNKEISNFYSSMAQGRAIGKSGASIEGRDHKGRIFLLLAAEEGSNKE